MTSWSLLAHGPTTIKPCREGKCEIRWKHRTVGAGEILLDYGPKYEGQWIQVFERKIMAYFDEYFYKAH